MNRNRERYLTEEEAGEFLGYSASWFQRQRWETRRTGQLRGPKWVKLPSGGIRYAESELWAWAHQNDRTVQAARSPAMRAVKNDRDTAARKRDARERLIEAARLFESLHPHLEVVLQERQGPPPKRPRPQLKLVSATPD